jgi:hypothetical protein
MRNSSKVNIQINEIGMGRIIIDGNELYGCTGFDVHSRVGNTVELTIHLIAEISADMECDLKKLTDYYGKDTKDNI